MEKGHLETLRQKETETISTLHVSVETLVDLSTVLRSLQRNKGVITVSRSVPRPRSFPEYPSFRYEEEQDE